MEATNPVAHDAVLRDGTDLLADGTGLRGDPQPHHLVGRVLAGVGEQLLDDAVDGVGQHRVRLLGVGEEDPNPYPFLAYRPRTARGT